VTAAPALDLQDLRGTQLGPYRLVTELGSGGMGTVYYAEHQLIGRRAAVKVLHPMVSSEANVERFFNEARSVNDIRHPNIVDVTDFGEHLVGPNQRLYYLVMELLEGETLAERIERCGRLPLGEVVHIIGQVLRGLQAAHQRGVVHRDLKPENIFLTNHPDYPDQVKILDFGIAKLEASGAAGNTEAGTVVGTPAYMSPEQCTADAQIDGRSDLYAMGIVTYEMLSGKLPFREPSFGRFVLAHLQKPVPRLPRVRTEVDEVVRRALAKDPEDRFADANAMRVALEAGATGRSLEQQTEVDAADERVAAQRTKKMAQKLELIIEKRLCDGSLVVPSMPLIAERCVELVDDGADLGRVARMLERDPLLATQVLRVANGHIYGGFGKITGVAQAVHRLGPDALRMLLVQMSARHVFDSRDPRIQQGFHAIWEHCLGVATIARELAQRLGAVDTDTAYMAGLLHDVGKPVVGALLLELERGVSAEAGAPWIGEAMWYRLIRRSHQRIGGHLGRRWKLPVVVREAISGFHSYEAGGASSCSNLVRFANALVRREGVDIGEIDPMKELEAIVQGRALLGVDVELERSLTRDLRERIEELTGEPTRRSTHPAPLSEHPLPRRSGHPTPML